ncbi:protein of unknown function [Nitrosotalea devaniterrae]|uniref:Uncharacterized protein n=1 Tax=Nitrosotalea devaniterrae TaxID=1078905 RepID=A0A128A3L7_9ARCH|nr:protein of unknown function [Candidatus Nitrosotalea devanaterra]
MIYKEKSIEKENLEKFLRTLDSDEGVRIDNESEHVFINKTSKRYCVNISIDNKDEFIYKDSTGEVMDFLKNHIRQETKISTY